VKRNAWGCTHAARRHAGRRAPPTSPSCRSRELPEGYSSKAKPNHPLKPTRPTVRERPILNVPGLDDNPWLRSTQQQPPSATEHEAAPKRRLKTDRERALVEEIGRLNDAMRAAAGNPNLNPMQKSSVIARHEAQAASDVGRAPARGRTRRRASSAVRRASAGTPSGSDSASSSVHPWSTRCASSSGSSRPFQTAPAGRGL
jgi:hypothetical protein